MKNYLSKDFFDLTKQLLRKMRTTFLILIMFASTVFATNVKSQVAKVNISMRNASVLEVLESIENQTDYLFVYNKDEVDLDRKMNINAVGRTIDDVLFDVFSNTGITHKKLGTSIILIKESALQNRVLTISGQVVDYSGIPLPGVTVLIKGTAQGTITDADGNYSIANVPVDATLIFSFVGMRTKEVVVSGQSVINVLLEEENIGLDEVVAIGYGSQKKYSVTGAISSVTGEEMSMTPEASLESALQGRAPGVSVINNGSPGTPPIVRIRGNGSISYSADPLYVVDGVATADMTSFNSKDIESVVVLKDASATAIYGSRAANGVILITTKKGKEDGQIHIDLDSYIGVQSIAKTLELLNTEQYLKYGTALNTAAGLAPPSRFANMNEPIYEGANQTYAQTNTDWQNELFQNAIISDNNISFSTGNEKSTYFASAAYFDQDGIIIGTNYRRSTFRFNSDHDISKRVKFGQTFMFSMGDKDNEQSSGGRSHIVNAIRSVPYLPVTDPTKDGGYRGANSGTDGTDPDNPVKVQNLNESTSGTNKLFGTAYLEFKLTDYLKLKSSVGLDYTNVLNKQHSPIYNDGFNGNTVATVSRQTFQSQTKTFTNQLTFDKTFDKHSLNIIAVQEATAYSSNYISLSGQLSTNAVDELTGLSNVTGDGNKQENLLRSYLGRINYEYQNKYLISVSMRADGSSKFAPGNKWGTFPSASLGWRVTEEPFMKNMDSVSDLKLRVGYGELGNNAIGNYDWQAVILANTEYVLNGATTGASYFNALPNEDLKWETSKMTNIGIDYGMFDNKFTFTAEWFTKLTDNLILAVPYPYSIGYYAPAYTNIGKMKNYGMEFAVGYRLNSGEFKSNLSANLSIVRNKVLNLSNETSTIDAGLSSTFGANTQTRTVIGQPIQSFYGWKTDGIFQSDAEVAAGPRQQGAAPGDIRFKDLSGPNGTPDGIIDAYDRTFLGSYLPKFSYGLDYTANFKRFDFSIFFQGVYGNKIYNGTKVITEGMLRLFNAGTEVLDAWTPTNTDTSIPRAISGDPNQNARTSNRFIEDGSYIRLKTLNIGYTLPLSVLTKNNVKKIRFYVSGQNLLTFTNYTGYDPEVGGTSLLTNGCDSGLNPSPRSILAGIQVKF